METQLILSSPSTKVIPEKAGWQARCRNDTGRKNNDGEKDAVIKAIENVVRVPRRARPSLLEPVYGSDS